MARITAPNPSKPGKSYRESLPGEAEEMYHDLAQELGDPEAAAEILAIMDERAVALAGAWASENGRPWPPAPECDVPKFSIWTV